MELLSKKNAKLKLAIHSNCSNQLQSKEEKERELEVGRDRKTELERKTDKESKQVYKV